MNFELFTLQEFFRINLKPNDIEIPEDASAILAAADAAKNLDHGDWHERMLAAIENGDAEAAHGASLEGATPLSVDTDAIEATANDAARVALRASHTWANLSAAYNSTGERLAEALKIASPNLLASQKAREAQVALPDIIGKVDSLCTALAQYMKVIEGVNVDNTAVWNGGRLSLFVRDDKAKRREFLAIWMRQDIGKRRSDIERLLEIVKAGGTLEAPAEPVYEAWDIPGMIGDLDPLTATPEEMAAATSSNRSDRWGGSYNIYGGSAEDAAAKPAAPVPDGDGFMAGLLGKRGR